MKKMIRNNSGITFVELMVAVGVVLISTIGVLYSYVKCLELNETGKIATVAAQGVRNKMEEIKTVAFSNIFNTYNNVKFDIRDDQGSKIIGGARYINGKGVIYVDNSETNVLEVKVVFSWKQTNGRVIGGDKDLDGDIDAGDVTDAHSPARLESYVQVISKIYNAL